MDNVKKQIREQMFRDIILQGQDVLAFIDSIELQISTILDQIDDIDKYKNIYFVGCGDSHYAGKAARFAFLEYSNIPAYSLEAYEYNQYEHKYIRDDAIVIAISVSGQVGTTLKALTHAKEKGNFVIGVNATPGCKMHSLTTNVIDIGIRVSEPGPVPQTVHYLGNLTTLNIIALQIGKRNGTINSEQYNVIMKQIKQNLFGIEANVNKINPAVAELASKVLHKGPYVFIGSGPNYATAEFAVAKLHEAACMGSIYQETEEWAHEQYFMTTPEVISFVIAQDGKGLGRSIDVIKSINKIKGISVVVTNVPEKIDSLADYTFSINFADNEILSPMVTKIVFELFAYSIANQLDIRPFDYDNEVRKKTCEETIYDGGVSAEDVARQHNY